MVLKVNGRARLLHCCMNTCKPEFSNLDVPSAQPWACGAPMLRLSGSCKGRWGERRFLVESKLRGSRWAGRVHRGHHSGLRYVLPFLHPVACSATDSCPAIMEVNAWCCTLSAKCLMLGAVRAALSVYLGLMVVLGGNGLESWNAQKVEFLLLSYCIHLQ